MALPSIERDLHASLATVQWVINAYAVVFGVVIVTGGRLADMLGRRRVFFIGAGIFAVFSLAGGLAPDPITLIACRAVMGAGGALMWPAMMGMTYDLLPESRAGWPEGSFSAQRDSGTPWGRCSGGCSRPNSAGAGSCTSTCVIAAVGVAATLRYIRPDGPCSADERLDYPGVAALTVGLVALLLALDFSSTAGWSSPGVIALLALSPLGLLAFALVERKAGTSALLPPDVIGNPAFAPACIAVLLLSAVFFSILLYLPQFMVRDLGWSAVAAGAGLLPMMITFAVASLVAGSLYGLAGRPGDRNLRRRLPDHRDLRPLVPPDPQRLRVAGPRHGDHWRRSRAVLLVDIDRCDHRARSGPGQPGGRRRLHVPGRGRVGRPGGQHRHRGCGRPLGGRLVSGIQHAFLVDAAAGLLGTAVTVTRVGTRPTPHDEGAGRRLGHHRLVHNRDA